MNESTSRPEQTDREQTDRAQTDRAPVGRAPTDPTATEREAGGRPASDRPDPNRLLRIYLDDHWAASGAGTSLANRLLEANRSSPWAAELSRVVAEIEQDQRTLGRLREACGEGGGFSVKRVLAQAAERVGRLKLNGALMGYSPLSRVLELEGLMAGVQAKRCLWRSLRNCAVGWLDVDLDQMERRAAEQLDTLAPVHEAASALAFGTRPGTSTD